MEREADRVGFGVMTQAGFAPQGAAAMFEKLQYASRLNDNGSYPYLRSHPLTTERISDMQARFQFQVDGRSRRSTPLTLEHAMIAARARVLSRPGVDVLRPWVAGGPRRRLRPRRTPTGRPALLYAAALAASELRDHRAARALSGRLTARSAGDAGRRAAGAPAGGRDRAGRAATPAAASALLDAKAQGPARRCCWRPRPPSARARAGGGRWRRRCATGWPRIRATPPPGACWRNLYGAQGETLRAVRAEAEANVAQLDYPAARDRFKAAQELMREGRRRARGRPLRGVDHRHPRARGRRAGQGAGGRAAAALRRRPAGAASAAGRPVLGLA